VQTLHGFGVPGWGVMAQAIVVVDDDGAHGGELHAGGFAIVLQ
jgi:hypothetical protein